MCKNIFSGLIVASFILSSLSTAQAARETRSVRVSVKAGTSSVSRPVVQPAAPMPLREKGVKLSSGMLDALQELAENDKAIALRLYYTAIDGFQMEKETDKALELVNEAIRVFPDQPDFSNRLMLIYQQRGEHDKVIDLAERLSKTYPDNFSYKQVLINTYVAKGDKKTAAGIAESLARSHPDDAHMQLQCAAFLEMQGESAEAAKYYMAALKISPNNISVMQQAARAYVMNKKFDEAKKIYEKLAKSEEGWVQREAQRQLLSIAMQENALKAFISEAEASLSKDSRSANSYWRLIEAYTADNKPNEVIKILERAIKQFPDEPEFSTKLIYLYSTSGEQEKALSLIKSLIADNPRDLNLKMQYANIQSDMGKYKEAIATYESLAKSDPTNISYEEHIAALYARSNETDKAIRAYEKLLQGAKEEWRKTNYTSMLQQLKQKEETR